MDKRLSDLLISETYYNRPSNEEVLGKLYDAISERPGGNVDNVKKWLVENPHVELPSGMLYLAITRWSLDIVNCLLEDPRIESSLELSMIVAVVTGYLPVSMRLLEDPRIDPSVWDNEALRYAMEFADLGHRHLQIVELLSKDPRVIAKINANGLLSVIFDKYMKYLKTLN